MYGALSILIKRWLWAISVLSLVVLISFIWHDDKAQLNFYWMPYCPYGQDAARMLLPLCKDEDSFKKIRFFYIAHEFSGAAPLLIGNCFFGVAGAGRWGLIQ
jgi:hypothetical protein